MPSAFARSLDAINSDLPLLALVAVGSVVFIGSGLWAWAVLLALIVSLVAELVLYGRIKSRISEESLPPAREIILVNWFNYVVVIVLIGLITWLLIQGARYLAPTIWMFVAAQEGAKLLVSAFTVFVIPIVFLRRVNIVAIPAGVLYLFKNLRESVLPLALIGVAGGLGAIRYILVLRGEVEGPLLWGTLVLTGAALTYLLILAFAAATSVIIWGKGNGVSPN